MQQQTLIQNPTYVFRPQPGPQTDFLATSADIAIYGGSAGSGKTRALLYEPLRHHKVPGAQMVIFRRDRPRITNPGSMWDESNKIYPCFKAIPNLQKLSWEFPSTARVTMLGLQHEADVLGYHGSQFMWIGFDELPEFTEYQFWYMLSRNRSDTGISGYVRATCNPDSESWVKDLIRWYLKDDGFPDPERAGHIRWFCRINDAMYWGNSRQELIDNYKVEPIDCKSFTFIPATIDDNQILLKTDPQYLSNLRALGEVEKQRLLYGNWNVKATGKIFRQGDFQVFTRQPAAHAYKRIYIDTAQKTKTANDYNVLQAWVKKDQHIYLVDQVRGKFTYPDLEQLSLGFLEKHFDAEYCAIEDKVSGTSLIQSLQRKQPMQIKAIQRSKDKFTRAFDAQGYIQAGHVYLNVIADYFTDFIAEATAFNAEGTHKHDDQIDPMLDAIYDMLINPSTRNGRNNKGSEQSFAKTVV